MAEFCFDVVDESYPRRAKEQRQRGPHAVVAGKNYGQGSSREHAALAPRSLGLRVVVAQSFARIHYQNLVSFGVLPLRFIEPEDLVRIERGTTLLFDGLHGGLRDGKTIRARLGDDQQFELGHDLSPRQVALLLAGGVIPWKRARDRGM
jgi:aconitate hydratase